MKVLFRRLEQMAEWQSSVQSGAVILFEPPTKRQQVFDCNGPK